MLLEYHWPGNVRELQNVIERMVVRARTDVIGADDVPHEVRVTPKAGDADPRAPPHDRRRAVRADHQRAAVVLDDGLPAVHAARDHAQRRPRRRPPRPAGRARQLQDRGAQVQHGNATTTSGSSISCASTIASRRSRNSDDRRLSVPDRRHRLVRSVPSAGRSARRRPAGRGGRRRATARRRAARAAAAGGAAWRPTTSSGRDDVLSILFWRDKDLSAPEVTVRPDGKVTLPLLNDVQAAGRTPEQLRDAIREAAQQVRRGPESDGDRQGDQEPPGCSSPGRSRSRGPYPLNGTTTILQLIAIAGGLRSSPTARTSRWCATRAASRSSSPFNYQDVVKKKNLRQNIELKPGDTVVVP